MSLRVCNMRIQTDNDNVKHCTCTCAKYTATYVYLTSVAISAVHSPSKHIYAKRSIQDLIIYGRDNQLFIYSKNNNQLFIECLLGFVFFVVVVEGFSSCRLCRVIRQSRELISPCPAKEERRSKMEASKKRKQEQPKPFIARFL